MENTTSHHEYGIWFHITWEGDQGVDHRGRKWVNRKNPQPKDAPYLRPLCKLYHDMINLVQKITKS